MKVKDIMTGSPCFCTSGTSLEQVARLLTEHDCGAIPVVDDEAFPRPVGIVTDRDIVCRIVAAGEDPHQATVPHAPATKRSVHAVRNARSRAWPARSSSARWSDRQELFLGAGHAQSSYRSWYRTQD